MASSVTVFNNGDGIFMSQQGKRIRVCITTASKTLYEGTFLIPPMRNRLSDVLNEEERKFINITDVIVNKESSVPFVSLNKNFIESVSEAAIE